MAKTPRPRRKALFPEAMRPVPMRIRELRERYRIENDRHTAESRASNQRAVLEAFTEKASSPVHVLNELASAMNLVRNQAKLNKMKKEIKNWEKEETKRSRGVMALRRIVHSPKAYLRLQRMRALARAKQEISDLQVLRAADEMGKLNRFEKGELSFLESREKNNIRMIEKQRRQTILSTRT